MQIKDLKDFDVNDFDAIILPGGYGAAKNLSSFAFNGADCTVNEDLAKALRAMHGAKKPIAALCIAPVIMAKIFEGARLTIGEDKGTADAIAAMGAEHVRATHGEIVVDETHRIVTTPCYMLDATISQIADGTEGAVRAVLEMIDG